MELIDSHRHFTKDVSNEDELLLQMSRDGISLTVLFGYHGLATENPGSQDQYIADLAQKYPKKIIPFLCDIDITKPEFHDYVTERLESGIFKGIGELLYGHDLFHRQFFPTICLNDSSIQSLCGIAAENKVPILMHVDPPFMEQFISLVGSCERTMFICPHVAYNFLSSYGGSEQGLDQITHMLESFKNLYFDISLWKISPIYLLEKPWLDLLETYSHRFLFGTDMTDHYLLQSVWMPAYLTILEHLSAEAASSIGKNTIVGMGIT